MPTRSDGDGALALPERPCLKPWYRLARSNGRLILEYGHSPVTLEGRAVEKLLPALLPLLDGTRTLEQIRHSLGEQVEPAIRKALAMLSEHGLLTDGPSSADTAAAETAALLAAQSGDGLTMAEAEDALGAAEVGVVGSGEVASEIADALRHAGLSRLGILEWSASGNQLESMQLALVAPGPAELPELDRWNRRALDSMLPWLQVLPFDGRIAAVGPLYLPGETCCYECYLRRRASNAGLRGDDYLALQAAQAAFPSTAPLQLMIAGMAATLALRWLGERAAGQIASSVPGAMHAIEWTGTVELSRHFVYRVPRCPVCFEDDRGTPAPWYA